METVEIWKDVVGYEGKYQVSNLGNVKSICRGKCKTLKPSDTKGYKVVRLYDGVRKKGTCIHRLVAQAFILNPENKPQVNHKNGIRYDNIVENLEWCTMSENQLHKFRVLGYKITHKICRSGIEHPRRREVVQKTIDGKFIKKWDTMIDIEKQLGFSHQGVGDCCRGRQKTSYGFTWEYVKNMNIR